MKRVDDAHLRQWPLDNPRKSIMTVVIGFPVVVSLVAYFFAGRGDATQTFLEGMTGTWPTVGADSPSMLAAGIGLIVFVSLAIPIALGVLLETMISRSERNIRHDMNALFVQRDQYFVAKLFGDMEKHFERRNISVPDDLYEVVKESVEMASSDWRRNTAPDG